MGACASFGERPPACLRTAIIRSDVSAAAEVYYELNGNFDVSGLRAGNVQALVSAWQSGAISRDTLLHNLRGADILPPGRTEVDEAKLIKEEGRRQN